MPPSRSTRRGRAPSTTQARAELERLSAHPRVVAIGETGMDMYWPGKLDGCADPAEQREAFAWHIELAKRTGKPLMIHNREADEEVLDVLRAEGAPETVIFHCFSSGPEMARACIDAGWLLSLSGTVSFRNARELREAARLIPAAQLLVETDAPFLAPHPYRGAPNESYCLPYTVRALAEVLGRPAVELAHETSRNADSCLRTRQLARVARPWPFRYRSVMQTVGGHGFEPADPIVGIDTFECLEHASMKHARRCFASSWRQCCWRWRLRADTP